jgi:2-polyprenyl-3-methyl-5-hydroxy-6-metoxy-1,4-benzoquinol methylase
LSGEVDKKFSTTSAETNKAVSYDPSYFTPLFAIEDRHFWFRARNRVISILARQIKGDLEPGCRVLEVGCGTGSVLRVLEQVFSPGAVVGMDLFIEGLRYAQRRAACSLVQGDIHAPPFQGQFDMIGCFDVLEHLPNDVQVLHDLRAMLAEHGALLLTVPAHKSLWSYFDEASHHCRRYGMAELEAKLAASGYRIEYMTQFMACIFPVVWLGRRLARLAARRGLSSDRLAANELRVTPIINDIASLLLAPEARLIARRRRLPVGTSLLAVARKHTVAIE